jgi:hypothetical protein
MGRKWTPGAKTGTTDSHFGWVPKPGGGKNVGSAILWSWSTGPWAKGRVCHVCVYQAVCIDMCVRMLANVCVCSHVHACFSVCVSVVASRCEGLAVCTCVWQGQGSQNWTSSFAQLRELSLQWCPAVSSGLLLSSCFWIPVHLTVIFWVSFVCVCGGTRVWTQGPMFARQTLLSFEPFCKPFLWWVFFVFFFFEIGSRELFAGGWLWTSVLLISASLVAKIMGVSHRTQLRFWLSCASYHFGSKNFQPVFC